MGKKKPEKERNTALWVFGGLLLAVPLVGLFAWNSTPKTEHGIYRAWYAPTKDGGVVLYEHGSHTAATYNSEPRYSRGARSSYRLIAKRVSDGAQLGILPKAENAKLLGVFGTRLWFSPSKGQVQLLAIDTLTPVADAAAIEAKLGQRFELDGTAFVDPHTGQLKVQTADGKHHLVGPDLSIDQPGMNEKPPRKNRHCDVRRAELIEPSSSVCLPPTSHPATALGTSKVSALRDAPDERMLFAVDARDQKAEVLWKKPLREIAGTAKEPFLSGVQSVGPRRAVVMLASDGPQLQLVFIDPVDGKELERKSVGKKPSTK